MIRICCLLLFLFHIHAPGSAQIEKIKEHYAHADEVATENAISFVQPSMGLIDQFDDLQQIVLIRHGEPALNKKGWFNRNEAWKFIKDYDSVGVRPLHFIPVVLDNSDVNTIHTSTLNRARHTARLVFGDGVHYMEDSLFREFERRIIGFPNIKMPLKFWLLNSRLFWLMGGNKKNIESFKQARYRSKQASEKLSQYASEEKKVVLVAHGFLNRQLIKDLKKQGWHLVRNGGSNYLAASLLVRVRKL